MLIDALFDRLVIRRRRSRPQQYDQFSGTPGPTTTGKRKAKINHRGSGILNGAHHLVVNQPTFIERSQIVQNFGAGKPDFDPVLERIAPYTNLDAAMDSSARFPPPLCHPGTRLKIGDRLSNWLTNPQRRWSMLWVHGPAGTGKSAVAQTFAERCAENERLGASFFFSRPNDRNNPDTVIPSLVYQLAVSLPQYKSLVTAQLAHDPELFRKTRRTQFKKLIVEPFSSLHMQEPLLIVLDGLDECKGEDAQREIVEMINEVVRLKRDFPLVWLICSRSEPHLKYLFSRADFTVNCDREELVIDAESIADVDLYLRDGLAGMKEHFWDVTTETWPPKEQVTKLSDYASGHFAFASTALRYIGDQTHAAPMSRLDALLAFLRGIRTAASNPLAPLDALYTQILQDAPDEYIPTLKIILGYSVFLGFGGELKSTQAVCNFFHIDQARFYSAFRRAHSVIDVPSPEAASKTHIDFYHASFADYLFDPHRSGKFAVSEQDFWFECAKSCLSWHNINPVLCWSATYRLDDHEILPGLKWISNDTEAKISLDIAKHAASDWCWYACNSVAEWDEELLSQIRRFNFRYVRRETIVRGDDWRGFVNRLWEVDSSSGIIRTEPHNEVDFHLLELMKSAVEPTLTRPATFPLTWDPDGVGNYFLLGRGSTAVVCWTTGHSSSLLRFREMHCDESPSKERIDAYRTWLGRRNNQSEEVT